MRDCNAPVARVCRGLFLKKLHGVYRQLQYVLLAASFSVFREGYVRSPCGGTNWLSPLWVVSICGVFMLQPPGVRNVKSAGEKRPERPLSIPSLRRLIRSLRSRTRFGVEAHRSLRLEREHRTNASPFLAVLFLYPIAT